MNNSKVEFKEWEYSLRKLNEDKYEVECQDWIDTDNNKHISHNEVWFTMLYKNGEITILNGWHIGTEDFSWSEKEDGKYYIEHYHKGLLAQVKKQLKEKYDEV